jgi:hypothetical protein
VPRDAKADRSAISWPKPNAASQACSSALSKRCARAIVPVLLE